MIAKVNKYLIRSIREIHDQHKQILNFEQKQQKLMALNEKIKTLMNLFDDSIIDQKMVEPMKHSSICLLQFDTIKLDPGIMLK